MKAKNAIPGTDIRQQIGTSVISPAHATSPGGTVSVLKRAIHNWRSQSQSFQHFNTFILFLDGTYQGYSAGTKNAWDTAAASMPNCQLCGCTSTGITGQQFHRAMNLSGLDTSTIPVPLPPDTSMWLYNFITDWDFQPLSAPPGSFLQINPGGVGPNPYTLYLRPRRAHAGISQVMPLGNPWLLHPGDPVFDFLINFQNVSGVQWCLSMLGGLPVSTGATFVATSL